MAQLPSSVRGKWIWFSADTTPRTEEYLFFRRSLTLAEIPAGAQLWIAARTAFHAYVNGRHVGTGPTPRPTLDGNPLMMFEVGYFLQTGRNIFAVQVHNTRTARTGCPRVDGGLWCQLDLDGHPMLWTDQTWSVLPGDCPLDNRPRRSVDSGFCESIDLRVFPHGWTEEDFDEQHWKSPTSVQSVTVHGNQVLSNRTPEMSANFEAASKVIRRGTWQQKSAVSFLTFAELAGDRRAAVFAGRSGFHVERECSIPLNVFCDNPYRLFLNGELVREQGVTPPVCGQPVDVVDSPVGGDAGLRSVETELRARKGWNEIVFAERTHRRAAGAGFVFPDTSPGDIELLNGPGDDAEKGWAVLEPLRMPLALVTAELGFDTARTHTYKPELSSWINEVALLHALDTIADPETEEQPENRELQRNEFILYDLGSVAYGCPELQIAAAESDILYVITAETPPINGALPPRRDGRQDVETVICDHGVQSWHAFHPRTFRYMMIITRDVEQLLTIREAGVRRFEFHHPNQGTLRTSDSGLQSIWNLGVQTLHATVQGEFVDAPAGRVEQSVPEAMMQSWAAYHAFGTYELAGQCLADFARGQYETGDIRPTCPTGRFIYQPQYSLFWPVWFYEQYLYSGNADLAGKLLPALRRYLAYLQQWAGDEHLLRQPEKGCAVRRFIDWPVSPPGAVSTALNALYCRALFSAARLFELLQSSEEAKDLRGRAAQTSHALRQQCWQPETRTFADFAMDGETSDDASVATNLLALYGGVVPSAAAQDIFRRFALEVSDEDALGRSSLFRNIVLQIGLMMGERRWALEHIRTFWGRMIERGADTGWELCDAEGEHFPEAGALCYGAAATPCGFLCAEIAGIRPAAPGFSVAYFNPLLLEVTQLSVRIPTVHGHIAVEWHTDGDEVEARVHASYPLDLIPVFSPELEEKLTLHLSENVSLLVQEGE